MKTVLEGIEAQRAPDALAPPELSSDVAQIISFLAEAVQPEKIFLLNHPTLDGETEAGYVDLLVVLPCKPHIRFTEHQSIVEFANLRHRQVSCSLHRSDAVREALERGHIYYSLACRLERLVYDSSCDALPATPAHLLRELGERARLQFEASYSKAHAFYDCAQNCTSLPVAAFQLHQAAEMTYRAILLSLMEKEMHTHSIKALIKHSRRCAPQLNAVFPRDTPEEKQLVHLLEEAYLKARYEPDYRIDKAVAELLLERVGWLLTVAKQVIKEKLNRLL